MLLTAVYEEFQHHATLRFRQEGLFAAVITQTVVCLHLKKVVVAARKCPARGVIQRSSEVKVPKAKHLKEKAKKKKKNSEGSVCTVCMYSNGVLSL